MRTTQQLRQFLTTGLVCIGAAVLAITAAVLAMGALAFLIDALRAGGAGPAPHPLRAAGEDAVGAFYLSQLVGVSFFNHTGELRFAALPGLFLIGLSVSSATALAVRVLPGSPRRRMRLGLLVPACFALVAGFAAIFVPMQVTIRGFGEQIAVTPSPVEAFVLPAAWALLFGSVGVLVGLHGRGSRREAVRLLGRWAAPLSTTVRVLAVSLVACALVTIIGAFALFGDEARSLAFGSVTTTLGTALIALPTLVATVFLAAFGVSVDWGMSALSQGHGSISAFGGPLPTTAAHPAGSVPGFVALLPLLGLATVLSLGWWTARGADGDVKLGLVNALRAAALLTVFAWMIGLLARLDAQVGGLLGLHFGPDAGSLLWHVPLLAFLGCGLGATARALFNGVESRGQLKVVLGEAAAAVGSGASGRWADPARNGVVGRATTGLAFAAVPIMVVAIGPTGSASSTPPPKVDYAPIAKAAEAELEEDSTGAVRVAVNPSTRALGSANVHIPLAAAGASTAEPPAAKARTVLSQYGDLFGLSSHPSELGSSQAKTDSLGMTHVYFDQMADGVPVFGSRIGVHFAPGEKFVTSMNGSVVPDLSVADDEVQLTSQEALARANQALPGGAPVKAPSMQVYAGVGPRISGSAARLAWFVWLIDEKRQISNEYVIDAVDGKVLEVLPKVNTARNRLVYNAKNGTSLPGTLARSEGQAPTGNADVDHAYEYTGDTYNFYKEWFGRDSFDNHGASLISTAHFRPHYENAYWNGVQMVFGDNFASARDVVGHELTHAVTEYTANLVYSYQSGALNESFSDIMGESVEWFAGGSADWLMGENLPGGAFRSLKHPNEHSEMGPPDPENLSEWWAGCEDNFGVHQNSTITSHAYYLIATSLGVPTAAQIFYRTLTVYLNPQSTLEDARNGAIQSAADLYGSGSKQYNSVVSAFNEVGLNGTAQPPAPNCTIIFVCAFARALKDEEDTNSPSSTLAMLETLYRARGQLAQTSAAGHYFLPLYEEHMGRVTELVSEDPQLEETAVSGLQEITPALEGLMEGEGSKFTLSHSEMAKIQAALKRLAQDDRLFGGEDAGELADLIERELKWVHLPSYGGMNYASGFQRLNTEVESHTMTLEEPAVITDPNCTGRPYSNDFQINGFYADTPGHYIPGQVSPLVASGVACGTSVEAKGSPTTCTGKASLNTKMTVQLPPGDKVNPTANMASGSWVGVAIGRAIACAGEESRIIYGGAGLRSLKTWTVSQCPASVIACYEGRATYEGHEGHSYAWVSEEGGKLTLTTGPVEVIVEGMPVPVGFGEFGVELCARAGEPGTKACGGPSAPWIHQNGEAGEPGCPTGKGRFVAQVTNSASETTTPAQTCIDWDQKAHMQTLESGTALNSISCIPSTTACVAASSKGNALYSTNVSTTAGATWTSWAGPSGQSPAEAIACPSTTLCELADGSVAGGGGNLYRASTLGGSFLTSFTPANGVNAISCPTTSFCVASEEGEGFIRYSTKPSGVTWTSLSIGTGAMKGVSCLSASFCAVVDGTGNVHVAVSEGGIKEAAGWKATNIDGTTALKGVACSSTTSCLAVDGSAEILKLAIAAGGEASVTKQKLEGGSELTSVTCTGSTCVAIDQGGYAYSSTSGGASWKRSHGLGAGVKSVSCISATFCAAVNSAGEAVAFNPE